MQIETPAIQLYQSLDFQHIERVHQCAAGFFGPNLYFMDGNFHSLMQAVQMPPLSPELRRLSGRLTPAQPMVQMQKEETCWLLGAVYRQNLPVVLVAAGGERTAFQQEELLLFQTLLDVLNLWISAQTPRDMLYRRTSSSYINFLIDLLRGTIAGQADLERRLQLLSMQSPAEFVILTIDMENYAENLSMYFIADAVTALLHCPMFCFYEDKLTFLVDNVSTPVWSRAEQLEELLHTSSLCAAYSLSCTDLLQTNICYMDAQKTLELGRRLHPALCLYEASKYVTYIMIDGMTGRLSIIKNINPLLMTLQHHDEEHHSSLLRTLYCYLRHPKDPDAAAADLHIHRNTFFYRMRQIRKLAGGEAPDDGETIMQLMLSYHIMFYNGMIDWSP